MPGQPSSESGEGAPSDDPAQGAQPRPAETPTDAQGQTGRVPSGSQPGDSRGDEGTGPASEDSADEANFDYTRRATDMALEYLKDQQQETDLRERLGWTQDEMQAFLRRWEQLRRESRQNGERGERAQRRLQDQLRGLGLQPPAERVRGSQVTKDPLRNLRQGGSEVPIPAEYLEQYRAFLKSVPTSSDRPK